MVMFHNELCKGRMSTERLGPKYFVMRVNFSLKVGERCANPHTLPLNQIAEIEGFQLDSTTGYHDKHNMI